MPTAISPILTRMYNDPAFFAELLQADEAHESIERNDKLMDDISRKSLTLNGLVQMRRDRIHRRNPEDGKVRTLMDLENVCESNALEDFTSLQWSKYPPFRGWDD